MDHNQNWESGLLGWADFAKTLSQALGQQENVNARDFHWLIPCHQPTRELTFNSRAQLCLSLLSVWTACGRGWESLTVVQGVAGRQQEEIRGRKQKIEANNDQEELEMNCLCSWASSCLTSRVCCVKRRGVRLDEERESEAQTDREMWSTDLQLTPGLTEHLAYLKPLLWGALVSECLRNSSN